MGFTLLEVVVGMAIVGLGVVTLLEIFSSGLRLETRGTERTEAVGIGRRVMDEVLVRRELPDGREEGSVGVRHSWLLEIGPLRDNSDLLISSRWALKEISLHLGDSVQMKTFRLVHEERK